MRFLPIKKLARCWTSHFQTTALAGTYTPSCVLRSQQRQLSARSYTLSVPTKRQDTVYRTRAHFAFKTASMSTEEAQQAIPGWSYELRPFKVWGAEVFGIDLKQPVPDETVERIKQDVTKYRVVVFRNQGIVSGEKQVEISRWFGEPESTFYKHPRSPHPDVFRVSNDDSEGCTGVGRTGWHIDGSFQPEPFSHSTYHIVSVPREGATVFAPLREVVESLPEAKRQKWERLHMFSDRRSKTPHPLIYSHPLTGDPTLCFHTGMTEGFIWDLGTPQQRMASLQETTSILQEIEDTFQHDIGHLKYKHKWQQGDFIISDNLAVGHEASPDTQRPVAEVGLRVMHRTTIGGCSQPCKQYDLPHAAAMQAEQ